MGCCKFRDIYGYTEASRLAEPESKPDNDINSNSAEQTESSLINQFDTDSVKRTTDENNIIPSNVRSAITASVNNLIDHQIIIKEGK